MFKNGAVIFFSGTGNSKYIAKLFKEEFEKSNINLDIINIEKEEILKKEYDFYVFGGPIHAEMLPRILINWIKKNIPNKSKKCIVYHTLAGDKHSERRVYLAKLLNKKGLDVVINTSIQMPNNYYHRFFKRDTDDEIIKILNSAPVKVKSIVKDFLNDKRSDINYKKVTIGIKLVYDSFLVYVRKYPKRNFSVDSTKCINCKICEQECPTNNIRINEKSIEFYNKCIGCEKCIHRCPTNAILFRKEAFKQYKIEDYIK